MEKNTKINAQAKDHLANERTFLAWIRTSLGIMAFGFVIEKFALFFNQITFLVGQPKVDSEMKIHNSSFGLSLIIIGLLICLLSFFQYRNITRQINNENYRPTTLLNLMLTLSILIIGICIIFYWKNI